MFQITPRAAHHLKAAMASNNRVDEAYVRVRVEGRKVHLAVDVSRPGDTAIDYEGETLVLLDPVANDELKDRKLVCDDHALHLVIQEAD